MGGPSQQARETRTARPARDLNSAWGDRSRRGVALFLITPRTSGREEGDSFYLFWSWEVYSGPAGLRPCRPLHPVLVCPSEVLHSVVIPYSDSSWPSPSSTLTSPLGPSGSVCPQSLLLPGMAWIIQDNSPISDFFITSADSLLEHIGGFIEEKGKFPSPSEGSSL